MDWWVRIEVRRLDMCEWRRGMEIFALERVGDPSFERVDSGFMVVIGVRLVSVWLKILQRGMAILEVLTWGVCG